MKNLLTQLIDGLFRLPLLRRIRFGHRPVVENAREFTRAMNDLRRDQNNVWLSGPRQEVLDQAVAVAESAWQLPKGYFDSEDIQWNGCDSMDLENHTSIRTYGNAQSPLAMLMAGGSTTRTEEWVDALWADPRYRQAVAHVFARIGEGMDYFGGLITMFKAAELLIESGYGSPMGRVINRAFKEGLVGCRRDRTFLEGHRYLVV